MRERESERERERFLKIERGRENDSGGTAGGEIKGDKERITKKIEAEKEKKVTLI